MEQAIAKVKDSVVEITTERLQSGFGSFSQYVVSGAGSGVIISTDGYIITNNHVIEGASNIMVRLTNGKEYNATLIATDSKTDIAVISIEPDQKEKLSPAIIGSSQNLMLGQTVIAIGNPLGKLGGTVSDGIISCLAREIAIEGS
jgi:serine protease Do